MRVKTWYGDKQQLYITHIIKYWYLQMGVKIWFWDKQQLFITHIIKYWY